MPSIQSVKSDNDVLTRIIKYIPAEIITIYTSAGAILSGGQIDNCKNVGVFKWLVISLIIITPLWKYYSVKDNPLPIGGRILKAAIFHASIATISFCLYVYVAGDVLLKCWITDKYFNPVAGAVVLLLFSIALVPLLERILLKEPPSPAIQ